MHECRGNGNNPAAVQRKGSEDRRPPPGAKAVAVRQGASGRSAHHDRPWTQPRRARPGRDPSGSGMEACWPHGSRCCCSGSGDRSCSGCPRGRSWDCRSRRRRGGRAKQGAVRPPRRVEPPAAEERVTQAPRTGEGRMRDPGLDTRVDAVCVERPAPPAIAHAAQPAAETGDRFLGQTAAAGLENQAKKGRRGAG